MRALRLQYFLAFAVVGSLLPYIPLYLRHMGLDATHIGYVLAAASVARMLSPVLVTFLADARIDARRVMAGLLVLSGVTLLAMPAMRGFGAILLIWGLHNLAFVPVAPLQDGINFSLQEQRRAAGVPPIAYHRIRVWGTIGFLLPCALLFVPLSHGWPVDWALYSGVVFAALGAANAFLLPDPKIRFRPDPASALPGSARLPTLDAARAMLRGPTLVFCIATFMLNAAVAAYYAFYPVYLRDRIHVPEWWIGPAVNLGVLVEVVFMLSFGRLLRVMGLKGFLLMGMACIALRMGLLSMAHSPVIAIGAQVFHGLMVLVLQVAPAVFLNRHAEDHCRHSMQGLYTMFVVGLAQIVGNLIAGPIAKWSLTALYAYAAVVAVGAMLLIAIGFPGEAAAPGSGALKGSSLATASAGGNTHTNARPGGS